MPRVSEAFGVLEGMAYTPRDADFHLTCPECGTEQGLSEAQRVDLDEGHSQYTCKKGDGLLVDVRHWQRFVGPGWRLNDWTIRNSTQMLFEPPGKAQGLTFDPRPLDPSIPEGPPPQATSE